MHDDHFSEVWTAAIASVLGLPDGTDSKDILSAVFTDAALDNKARSMGLCLVRARHIIIVAIPVCLSIEEIALKGSSKDDYFILQ